MRDDIGRGAIGVSSVAMKQHTAPAASAARRNAQTIKRPLWQRATAVLLVIAMELAPLQVALAQSAPAARPVADPFAPIQFRPSIGATSTGVPAVNITAPNAAGLSVNRYERFDIDAIGLILNNSLAGGNTFLGGALGANPNLAGRSAQLILNEVTRTGSAFASLLAGSLEVFGAPARVIIANPNGIVCAGCGFLNTPRVTLTTGTAQFLDAPDGAASAFEQAASLAFDVRGGRVSALSAIDGGMQRLDIIAERIVLNAALRTSLAEGEANQINLVAGRQRVAEAADGGLVTTPNGAINTAADIAGGAAYAIDASALGAMTSGRINVIATAQGMGVRAEGTLAASAGDITISADGEVRIANAYARHDVQIASRADSVAVSGALLAEHDARIDAAANVSVGDVLAAVRDARISAGGTARLVGPTVTGRDTTIIAGDAITQGASADVGGAYTLRGGSIALDAATRAAGDVTLDARGNIAIAAPITTAGNVTIGSREGALAARGALTVGGDASLAAATDLTVAADATIGGNASFTAGGTLANERAIGIGGDATLRARDIDNSATGAIAAAGALGVTATGRIGNRGTLYGGTDTTLDAAVLDNAGGQTLAARDVSARAGALTNAGGTIAAARDARLELGAAPAPAEVGTVVATRDLAIAAPAATLDPSALNSIAAGGRLAIDAVAIDNNGLWRPNAASTTARAAGDLTNRGTIEAAGDLALAAGGAIITSGAITGNASVALTAPRIEQRGTLDVGENLTLAAGAGGITNTGIAQAVQDVTLSGARIANTGTLQAGRDLTATATGTLSNLGTVIAGRDLRANAARIETGFEAPASSVTTQSRIDPAILASVQLRADTCVPAGDGTCASGARAVSIDDLAPDYTAGTVRVLTGNDPVSGVAIYRTIALPRVVRTEFVESQGTRSGELLAGGNMSLGATGTLDARGARIAARGDLSIAAGAIDLSRSRTIANGSDEGIDLADHARFVAELNAAQPGAGFGVNPVVLSTATRTLGYAGTVQTAADARLSGGTFNNEGNLLAAGNLAIDLSGALVNRGQVLQSVTGAIPADRATSFSYASTLDRLPARIGAGGDVTIHAGSVANQAGEILAGGDLAIGSIARPVASVVNAGGVIEARRDTSIAANELTQTAGGTAEQRARFDTLPAYVAGVQARIADPAAQAQLFAEAPPDYMERNSRVELLSRNAIFLDRGTEGPWYNLTIGQSALPGTIAAGRDLAVNAQGTITNDSGIVAAGRNVTLEGASPGAEAARLDNRQAVNTARLDIDAGGGYQRIESRRPAGGVIQAGGSVSIRATDGASSANITAREIYAVGSTLTNGLTDPSIPPIGSSLPPAAIALVRPNLAGTLAAFGTSLAGQLTRTASGALLPPDLSALPGTGGGASLPPGFAGIGFLNGNPLTGSLSPLSPAYLLSLLPENLRASGNSGVGLFYADAYLEEQLLREAALAATGRAYFLAGLAYDDQAKVSVDTQQRAILYENAAAFARTNGLVLGRALTPEQIARLDRPMLWYVEQEVPDGKGGTVRAFVPTVYLPEADRLAMINLSGGTIRADTVSIRVRERLTNTGTIAANSLSIQAREFINAQRLANWGHYTESTKGGYLEIAGARVQPGGFIAAANLAIAAERIRSVSGELKVLGANEAETEARTAALLTDLRNRLGANFTQETARDQTRVKFFSDGSQENKQIAIAVVAIAVAIVTYGAASEFVGAAVGAQAGSGTAMAAAGSGVAAGAGNVALASAASAFSSSVASQLIASGRVDLSEAFKSAAISGHHRGLGARGGRIARERDPRGHHRGGGSGAGAGGEIVRAVEASTLLSDKLVGYVVRAGIGAGVQGLVRPGAGSFGTAFLNSVTASAAADAANLVGGLTAVPAGTDPGALRLANIAGHALVGCAAAMATGRDCGAGALGAASAAALNPILDEFTPSTSKAARDATLAGLATAAAGLIARGTGREIATAIGAAQNETLNNYLTRNQLEERQARLAAAKTASEREAALAISAAQYRLNIERVNSACLASATACRGALAELGREAEEQIAYGRKLQGNLSRTADAAERQKTANQIEQVDRSLQSITSQTLGALQAMRDRYGDPNAQAQMEQVAGIAKGGLAATFETMPSLEGKAGRVFLGAGASGLVSGAAVANAAGNAESGSPSSALSGAKGPVALANLASVELDAIGRLARPGDVVLIGDGLATATRLTQDMNVSPVPPRVKDLLGSNRRRQRVTKPGHAEGCGISTEHPSSRHSHKPAADRRRVVSRGDLSSRCASDPAKQSAHHHRVRYECLGPGSRACGSKAEQRSQCNRHPADGELMRDPAFFLTRYAPVTTEMAFAEMPLDDFAEALFVWTDTNTKRAKFPWQVKKQFLQGSLANKLDALLPLSLPRSSKELISATKSNWVTYIPNGSRGGDAHSAPRYLAGN